MRRPLPESPLQLLERLLVRSLGDDLDPAVGEIPRVAAQAEGPGVARDEPAESNALHVTRDEESAGHAGRLRRAFTASNTIGMTESAMIARITSVKFSRTTGMLPKKKPPSTNSPTQSTAPATL